MKVCGIDVVASSFLRIKALSTAKSSEDPEFAMFSLRLSHPCPRIISERRKDNLIL